MTDRPITQPLARFRALMSEHFGRAETKTYLQRLREAGDLPEGTPGRGGSGSAQLTVPQVTLALIALARGVSPIAAPTEAKRAGNFQLAGIERIEANDERFATVLWPLPAALEAPGIGSLSFLHMLATTIDAARGAIEDYPFPGEVRVSPHDARISIEPAEPPKNRNSYNPITLYFIDPITPRKVPLVSRETRISGVLIAQIAALFPPLPPTSTDDVLSAKLQAQLGEALAKAFKRTL
jgi:hypothetical protein